MLYKCDSSKYSDECYKQYDNSKCTIHMKGCKIVTRKFECCWMLLAKWICGHPIQGNHISTHT